MVLRFQDNQGIQALDTNQLIELVRGNSIVDTGNRFNVSVDTGTLGQGDTLQVDSGTALVGGSEASNSGTQSVQIDAADADNPRKDVVFIDSNGSAQVAKGTPEDPEPEGAQRFDLFQPAPPARNNVDGAVIAEVFVGAGSTSVSTSDLRDRRLFGDAELASLNFRSGYSPSSAGDAATKNYVDTEVTDSQIDVQDDGTSVLADAEALNFKGGHFAASDDTGGVAGVDISAGSLENSLLENSSVTVNAGDGLKSGGNVSLGGSVGLDVEPADFAGSFVSDDGADNLAVDIGTGLAGDGSGNIAVDESGVDHDALQNFVSNEHVDHSTVSVTGTGALTGGGDLTSSRSIDVAVNGVGTSELDESASFSFSNLGATTITGDLDMSNGNIDDVASIDGGGNDISVNDNLALSNVTIFDGANKPLIQANLDDARTVYTSDSTPANSLVTGLKFADNPVVNFQGTVSHSITSSGSDLLTINLDTGNNTSNETLRVQTGATGVGGGTTLLEIDGSGNLDLLNSGSIQDAGTDAIQFDGSANVTIPNGSLDMDENKILDLPSTDISGVNEGDGAIETSLNSSIEPASGELRMFEITDDVEDTIRIARGAALKEAFVVRNATQSFNMLTVKDGGEVDIPSGSLDLNTNNITSVGAVNGSDADKLSEQGWQEDPNSPKSVSNVSSLDFNLANSFDEVKLVIKNMQGTDSGTGEVRMTVNGDTGNNYFERLSDNTTNISDTKFVLGSNIGALDDEKFDGRLNVYTGGEVQVSGLLSRAERPVLVSGANGQQSDLNSFSIFYSTGNIDSTTVEVFGRNIQ